METSRSPREKQKGKLGGVLAIEVELRQREVGFQRKKMNIPVVKRFEPPMTREEEMPTVKDASAEVDVESLSAEGKLLESTNLHQLLRVRYCFFLQNTTEP